HDVRSLTCSKNNRLETLPLREIVSYNGSNSSCWLPEPHDTILLDHLPGLPQHALFDSYAAWFAALRMWMLLEGTSDRIGVHEVQPGVWAGLRTRISPLATLRPPCWLGANVYVGPQATIG